jgi:hypothetical protein
MRAAMGLHVSVNCDCDEGFEGAVFLWNAIAMRASMGLLSVDCNYDEGCNVATLRFTLPLYYKLMQKSIPNFPIYLSPNLERSLS